MSYRRTKAASFNELDRIERDVRSAVTALGVPIAMLRSSGFALSLDAGKIPMMVYDRDATEAIVGSISLRAVGAAVLWPPAGPSMA